VIVGLLEAGMRNCIGLLNAQEGGETDGINRFAKRLLTHPTVVSIIAQVWIFRSESWGT
jgi:hypothetical protein